MNNLATASLTEKNYLLNRYCFATTQRQSIFIQFEGIYHWNRAWNHVRRSQRNIAASMNSGTDSFYQAADFIWRRKRLEIFGGNSRSGSSSFWREEMACLPYWSVPSAKPQNLLHFINEQGRSLASLFWYEMPRQNETRVDIIIGFIFDSHATCEVAPANEASSNQTFSNV